MEQVCDFLKKAGTYFLATEEGESASGAPVWYSSFF